MVPGFLVFESSFLCRFLALPHPGLVLYRSCIELESNLASVGNKDGLVNARRLYESALTSHSQNASLWQNYFQFEKNVSSSLTIALPLRIWLIIKYSSLLTSQ